MNPLESVKRIPPMVWLIGGAVVVGLVILKSGASSGGGPSGVSGSGGGGGGAGQDELEILAQGFVDLTEQVKQQAEDDATWRAGIEDTLAGGAPTNPNPPPGGGTAPPIPGQGYPGGIKKVSAATTVWGKDIPAAWRKKYSLTSLQEVLRKSGVQRWGSGPTWAMNKADLKLAFKKEGINVGSTISMAELAKLYKKTGVKPAAPTTAKP